MVPGTAKRLTAYMLLVLAVGGLFTAGGHFLASGLVRSAQDRQLQELALLALRRAEAAVEHGASTLDSLAGRGALNCDAAALQSVRLDVYRGGAIKDIRVLSSSGSVICSAFSETLEFDQGNITREDMVAASGNDILLYPVELFFGTSLGIMRDHGAAGGIAAILGVGGSALDVLPDDLRPHGAVLLRMRDGRHVAGYGPGRDEMEAGKLRQTTRQSAAYPLETLVNVEEDALVGWNAELYRPIVLWSGLLGAAFGVLLARSVFAPMTPLRELDRGLSAREFEPFFQPVFDIATGEIRSAEVLARWVRADGTVVSPAGFIELAEQTGRVRALTWQILEKALSEAGELLQANRDFHLSFNATPDHFVSGEFVSRLVQTVTAAKFPPSQIGIEITERQGFDDPVKAAEVVADLKRRGFRVAIDDVGIGHSGLSQIQLLGADTIKIDKFFVDSISLDTSLNIVVEMLVKLARDKGMATIAEGIETEAQAAALGACGVTLGQGYLVAKPMKFSDFSAQYEAGAIAARAKEVAGQLKAAGVQAV
jgi:sensor c-di-GMP phosphodiesterase-like protein